MNITIRKDKDMNTISRPTNLFLNLFFIVYCLLCVIPMVLVFMVSITDVKALAIYGFSLFPSEFSFKAYEFIFNTPQFIVNGYKNSLFVTVVGTFISLAMTSLLAYPISRKDFRFRNKITFYLFFTMLFNGGLVPWFILYKNYLHLYDNIWVLIVPYLLSPWNVIMMRTFFSMNVPNEVVESARIDGANDLRIFISIVIKISIPAFATIGLFNTLAYWNDWWLSLLYIVDENKMSLQYLMYKTIRNAEEMAARAIQIQNIGGASAANIPTEPLKMAMAIMGIGPIIFAYPFFQKYFIKGLTIGAIKG